MASLTDAIKQEAARIGFDVIGIARVDEHPHSSSTRLPAADSEAALSPSGFIQTLYDRLSAWLARGFHATMEWMARTPQRRSDPRLVLPGCRSMICVGLNYFSDLQPRETEGIGRIARYAWGKDYHRLFDIRLKALEQAIVSLAPEAVCKRYVDTGPIMEKAWAQRAGLGWIGKHSNLVSPEFGSWLVLGEILTTLTLEPDEPGTDLCGSCRLCIQACPTGAIEDPYIVNAEKCLSYWTIEFRGNVEEVPQAIQRQIGHHLFGCDDCLEACPYNVNAQDTAEPAFHPTPLTLEPDVAVLERMNEEEFQRTFRESPIRRARYAGFQRNLRLVRSHAVSRNANVANPGPSLHHHPHSDHQGETEPHTAISRNSSEAQL